MALVSTVDRKTGTGAAHQSSGDARVSNEEVRIWPSRHPHECAHLLLLVDRMSILRSSELGLGQRRRTWTGLKIRIVGRLLEGTGKPIEPSRPWNILGRSA